MSELLKNWRFVALAITWIIACTLAYAGIKAQGDESARRIRALEDRPAVTLEQYQDGQRALEQRLQRIENKLDREKH